MKSRFAVCRPCCECEDCCNGNAPEEWDVEFETESEECVNCEDVFSGVFTLRRGIINNEGPGSGGYILGPCTWGYGYAGVEFSPNYDCQPGSGPYFPDNIGWNWIRRFVSLSVRCNGPNYRIEARLCLVAYDNWPYIGPVLQPSYHFNMFIFRADVPYTTWNCSEQVEYQLDYAFGYDWVWNLDCNLLIGKIAFDTTPPYSKLLCSIPAYVKITSVP